MISRVLLLLGLAVALASSTYAQSFGACEPGTAERILANSTLQATMFNTGALFFGGSTTAGDGYLVPKQNRTSPMIGASLWLAGTVEGDLRVAAARYGGWDFWPGPLEDAANPPTDCSEHDRIYVVSRDDIRKYYLTGVPTDDLRDWPYHLGAPVVDGDGDSTNYDLRAGDQPDLIGDQAAWWVMNDAGGDHGISGAPLGVEVRVLAFVYGRDGATASPILNQTSFYRYEIIHRGHESIEEMYATMWSGADLGDASDDYIGTDSLRNMAYVYNSNNEDASYGVAPPAQGIQFLQGPVGLANGRDDDRDGAVGEPGERLLATSGGTYINAGPDGTQDPNRPQAYYNYMRGLWANGSPKYEFRNGFHQTGAPTTRFQFAGDPVAEAFYSEMNVDGNGAGSPWGQRSMYISTGPFRLAPGDSTSLFFAFPYGQGGDHLQSVAVMRGYATVLQGLYADGFFASSPVEQTRPEPTFELTLSRVHPNPSSGAAEATLTLPTEAHASAVIFDLLGRQLTVLVDAELAKGETVLRLPDDLAPGTYLLRVRVKPGGEETLTFTVAR